MCVRTADTVSVPRFARVLVDVAADREFDYSVPAELAALVKPGSRVRVPFGKRVVAGYVVGLPEEAACARLKPISGVVGRQPLINDAMLGLAQWMADYYCATREQAVRTLLPGAVRGGRQRFKQALYVRLPAMREGEDTATQHAAIKLPEKQRKVLGYLRVHGSIPLVTLRRELDLSSAPIKALEKRGLVLIEPQTMERAPLGRRTVLPTAPLTLMPEQAVALDLILERLQDCEIACACAAPAVAATGGRGPRPSVAATEAARVAKQPATSSKASPHVVLLHGVTGSGKTEVYMQAIARGLERGRGAIVLVPEIALTPQTVDRFLARFGAQVAVLHSRLSEGERHDEWHRIQRGAARIVIGARSAVFAPVANLGIIIVDEEHEPSYKQDEAPRYNARDVAVMRGHNEHCVVVLGSATPALESWFNARNGKYALARLTKRVDHRRMPVMRVVDMRVETERSGHVSVFSQDLLEAIGRRLERSEQVILFLNRRGFATSLICPSCGHVAKCSNCSVSYTYHRQSEALLCHICGSSRKVPPKCPNCFDPAFKYSGIGTQRVEAALQRCFPKAVVQRMDSDTTTRKDAFESMLGAFKQGKTHILLGTQMIAKGLHFPNVTLVGVIYADLSLHMSDFRAGERTFQLLAQVAGRAGRGDVAGEVIVQTYTPFHPAVQAARRIDFEGFCDQEMEFRKELGYPPYSHLVCLTFRGRAEQKVSFSATTVAQRLKQAVSAKVHCSDACAAPLAKAKGLYRYQVMLRALSVKAMTLPLRRILGEMTFPDDVRCAVDVDALSLL